MLGVDLLSGISDDFFFNTDNFSIHVFDNPIACTHNLACSVCVPPDNSPGLT